MTETTTIANEFPRVKTIDEVQDALIENLADIVTYWINVNHSVSQPYSLENRLSGMMHSFHVTFSGFSGDFDASIDMYPFSTEEEANRLNAAGRNFFPASADTSDDINDGCMKYFRAETYLPAPEETYAPREWTAEEMRVLFLNKITDFYYEALVQSNLSDLEHGAYFIRSILNMLENGKGDFPRVFLLAVPHEDDKEYSLEQGEDYYEETGTPLTGQQRSLVDVWDAQWSRINES